MIEAPYPSRRERRRLATRENLLRAALSLISERGIYAARVEDITARADVAKGAFYLHFTSKSHLVAELLSEGVRALEASYRGPLERATTASDRIRLLVRAHAEFFRKDRAHALLFHQARGLQWLGGERDRSVAQVFARYLSDLGGVVLPETSRGKWSSEERVRLGAALVGGVSGYQSYERSAGLEPETDGILDGIAEAIAVLVRRNPRVATPPEQSGPA
jgi:AcrR family transcriptional regulator